MRLKNRDLLRAVVGDAPEKTMSGRRLARYVDVHPSFIDHLMSGRRSSCKPLTAERIAEALGLPLAVLFDAETSTGNQANIKQRAA